MAAIHEHIIETLRKNQVMTEHDLSNLEFLLLSSEETLKDWYFRCADEDDVAYARLLLNVASEYFTEKDDIDTSQAKMVIKQFML